MCAACDFTVAVHRSRPPAPGLSPVKHNWATMTEAVQSHVGSLSWGHRLALREKAVTYVNSYGEVVEHHRVKVSGALAPVVAPLASACPAGPRVPWSVCRAAAVCECPGVRPLWYQVKSDVCFAFFKATNEKGQEAFYTAAKFVIATGERPRYLGIQGDKEYCITRWG